MVTDIQCQYPTFSVQTVILGSIANAESVYKSTGYSVKNMVAYVIFIANNSKDHPDRKV